MSPHRFLLAEREEGKEGGGSPSPLSRSRLNDSVPRLHQGSVLPPRRGARHRGRLSRNLLFRIRNSTRPFLSVFKYRQAMQSRSKSVRRASVGSVRFEAFAACSLAYGCIRFGFSEVVEAAL